MAYGTAKRQSITGSVAVVDSKKISDRISTTVTGALEGSAPGVQVNNSYGEPGATPKIHIRGVGTLVKDADQPLYIVDGTPFEGNIAELNPGDIESMSVLKDASSAALYGNRAANGVVLITTKKAKFSTKPNISLKMDQGFYRRGIPEYDRLGPNEWMEASWIAMKNYALSGGIASTEAAAGTFATEHLMGDFVKRNIYDAADNALFDSNGKRPRARLPGRCGRSSPGGQPLLSPRVGRFAGLVGRFLGRFAVCTVGSPFASFLFGVRLRWCRTQGRELGNTGPHTRA